MHTEKKKNEKKNVKDDFYDRINYYESRNIFSTNEAFDPGNRLYTDQASLTHGVWDKINRPSNRYNEEEIEDRRPKHNVDNALAKSEFTQNLLSSITKLSGISNNAPIGCSKCGYETISKSNLKGKVNIQFLFSNLDDENMYNNQDGIDKDNENIDNKSEIIEMKQEKNNSKLSDISRKEMESLVQKELEKLNQKDKKDKKNKKRKKHKKEKKNKKNKKEKLENHRDRKSRSLSSKSKSSRSYSRSRSESRDKSKKKDKIKERISK